MDTCGIKTKGDSDKLKWERVSRWGTGPGGAERRSGYVQYQKKKKKEAGDKVSAKLTER